MSKDNGGKDKNKSTKPSAEEQVVINEYMNRIAGAESGYTMTDKKTGKLIKNPGSSAKGPFQFTDATWGQMEKNLGKTLKRDDWGDNITAMKELSRVNINKLNKDGIPVNEKNLYMLHFLGDSGGVDYLKKMQDNPNELASKYVSPEALKKNENIFVDKKTGKHRTASEVFNLMSSKVSKPAKYDVVGSNGTDFNEINRADQSAGMPGGQLQGREFIEQNRGDSFEGETFRDNTNVAPIRPEGLPKIQEEGLKQFINPVERKRNSLGMIGDGTTYISPESKLAFTEEQQAEEDIENEEYARMGGHQMTMSNSFRNEGDLNINRNSNRFSDGGNLTEFDEGGSHEENPMGGIPQGMGSNGKMNTVEEGETKLKGSNYILSDTLKVNENDADDLQLPKDVIGMTYADASKFINRIAKENPGDSLIQKDSRESLDRLTMGNEKARLDYEQLMDNFGLAGDEPNEDQDQMFLGGIAGGNNLDMISNIGSSFMNGANKQAVPGTEGVDSSGGQNAAGYVNLATTGLGFANDIFGKSGVDSSGETRPAEVNQTGMALSGAAKGAQAGMMFGGVGAAVGGVIGLGAGVLKGAKAKKDMLRGRQRNDIKLSNQKISDFRLGGNIEEGEDPKIGNLSPEQAKDFELQRSWLNNWNQNRVIDGKKINNGVDVPFSQDVYVDDLNYGKENKSTYGEFDSVSNRIVLDENYSNKQGIPAHELSHRFQKELKNGNSNNYENYINKPINDMIGPSGHLLGPYTSDPEENHAEINRFRYNNGIKPDQVISKEDMKGYDRKGYNLDHFDDDRLMGLLNTVADNGDDNKNNYARNGGNFENMNLSKTNRFRDGSYLDKYRTSKKEDDPNYEEEEKKEEKGVPAPYEARGEDPLRYSGLVGAGLNYLEDMNAKPDYAELGRMDNRYNQKYVDIKALENNSRNEANSQISALGEMGLSKGQLISNMAGANFNKNRSVSDSMFRASEINRSEDRAAYDYGSRNDQFNISQSDKENELNQMEDQAIDDRKRQSRDAMFLSAGELGKENTYKNRIFNMTGGYDTTGRFQNINGKVYENVNGNLILVDSEKKEGKKRNGGLVGKYSEYLETKRKERESIESLNRI